QALPLPRLVLGPPGTGATHGTHRHGPHATRRHARTAGRRGGRRAGPGRTRRVAADPGERTTAEPRRILRRRPAAERSDGATSSGTATGHGAHARRRRRRGVGLARVFRCPRLRVVIRPTAAILRRLLLLR